MAAGVVVVSQEGDIVFTNPSFDKLFGYDKGELLGRHASILNEGKPKECTTTVTAILSWLRTRGVWQGEIWNRKKDGTPFTTYTQISVVDIDETQYYVSVQEDITERRRLEAQFYERERLALIGAVAVSMSHEIGNRLNSFSSSVQLLKRFLTKPQALSLDDLAEIVQDLRAETAHMEEVLRALRELSIPHRLIIQPVDVRQPVTTVLRTQLSRCTEQGIRQAQSFPVPLPRVIADQEKLTHVLTKLCDNAIEAMPTGGTLTVKVSATTDMMSISVRDTGPGISEGIDPFEPFVSTRAGGSGLGLSVVKQLVLSQGGTIRYTSSPRDGTTFTVRLPIEIEPPSEATA